MNDNEIMKRIQKETEEKMEKIKEPSMAREENNEALNSKINYLK